MLLVTGGAGFIGSHFVAHCLRTSNESVLNLDKLTYAGNVENLQDVAGDARHTFIQGDIADTTLVSRLLEQYQPRAIINFAAESHVDRSILDPNHFLQTNVVGTVNLLEAARQYWSGLAAEARQAFRFLHISTDEVYGSLTPAEAAFTEARRYAPSTPYAASKAAADHFVRAYHQTYGLPVITTHCSNNYGPRQFPEKLIPLMIQRALNGQSLPIYGDGQQVRDWLFVNDHCAALSLILQSAIEQKTAGQTYHIGGQNEQTNQAVVVALCKILDACQPRADGQSYAQQIETVADRPGHDRRYAINANKLRDELGWQASTDFQTGLQQTVAWYLAHPAWLAGKTATPYQYQ